MVIEGAPFCAGAVVVMTGAAGGAVSMTAVIGPAVTVLPTVSVATAVKLCVPSARELAVKVQAPEPSIVADPRLADPSFTSTETMLGPTEPDSVGVLSFVMPPLAIVVVWPVSVAIVGLIVVFVVPDGGDGAEVDDCTIKASVVAPLPLPALTVAITSGAGAILTVVTNGCANGWMFVSGG
jgi:hypothetical protein